MRILVVEDDAFWRDTFSDSITDHDLKMASDLQSGLTLVNQKNLI